MKKIFYFIAAILIPGFAFVSCDDDSEGASPSELGNLEGTIWELSMYEMTVGGAHITEEYWGGSDLIKYADMVGLPYEKLDNQVNAVIDTLRNESVVTYTLSFANNTCTWNMDKAYTFKLKEYTATYERYKFTPQDFTLPNDRYKEYIDTIRVTNESIKYLYNSYFMNEGRFSVPLIDGIHYSFLNSSYKELPDGHLTESQQSTFTNLKVEPTSFIMQKGDDIYSAQYDVTAGWLILNMISPRHEEIGKFEIKKIK